MVTIAGTKYACERCIRGHRVSGCNHIDKPLTMIKKKGRPTTHCNHCRKGITTKPGVPPSCTCSRRERAVITPKELGTLQQDPTVKIEFSDGTLLSTENDDAINDDMLPPLDMPSQQGNDLSDLDTMGRTSGMGVLPSHDPASSVRSGRQDQYMNVPAFRYQSGFYGQPYNAALYNSTTGNNAAAAVVNAGGESTASAASATPDDEHTSMTSGYSPRDFAQEVRRHGTGIQTDTNDSSGLMNGHSLLATSSQELEASMKTLSPLGLPGFDVDREELVNGILRSPTTDSPSSPALRQEAPSQPSKEQGQDPYQTVQAMPKLSSLY